MNKETIAKYFNDHRDELLAFVGSRLGGNCYAEDVVQDIFLRLLVSDKMINETTLPCLAYTMARNMICDYYRHHHIKCEYAHEAAHQAMEHFSMESQVYANELTLHIERCLQKRVPENCHAIYRMHIYDGMKVSEISEQLGENYKSVEYRLGTARRQVRDYLRAAI